MITDRKMLRPRCSLMSFDLRAAFVTLLLAPISIYLLYAHGENFSNLLHPILSSPHEPFNEIPHYYHEKIAMDDLCTLHGWKKRTSPRQVFDAVLFNNEVDLIEIRWQELDPYVSEFILLESNSTFTGRKKTTDFALNRHRFRMFESKLSYGMIGGRFVKGENPFVEEARQRKALNDMIKMTGIKDDDLLIMSDVDEIPSGNTIDLLRWCDDIPQILHLRLRNYLYSFEFFLDNDSWRASVHRYNSSSTTYAHYRQSNDLLSDSGWHCSFCFRRISDFAFKMLAYSHTDRIKYSRFLDPSRIQGIICKGADLFDMLPKENSFKELIGKMGPMAHSHSAVHLPWYLIKNADKYKFLLPGNCKRE